MPDTSHTSGTLPRDTAPLPATSPIERDQVCPRCEGGQGGRGGWQTGPFWCECWTCGGTGRIPLLSSWDATEAVLRLSGTVIRPHIFLLHDGKLVGGLMVDPDIAFAVLQARQFSTGSEAEHAGASSASREQAGP